MNREDVINFLVEREAEVIVKDILLGKTNSLEDVIKNGVAGFVNLSNEELEEEYFEATDFQVKILK